MSQGSLPERHVSPAPGPCVPAPRIPPVLAGSCPLRPSDSPGHPPKAPPTTVGPVRCARRLPGGRGRFKRLRLGSAAVPLAASVPCMQIFQAWAVTAAQERGSFLLQWASRLLSLGGTMPPTCWDRNLLGFSNNASDVSLIGSRKVGKSLMGPLSRVSCCLG